METYMKMKDFNIEGTLLDNGWIENLKYDSGKTNINAVLILSEIVYWYRPTLVRDEITGDVLGYKKKFKADKLQKNYESLANRFGLTKRQCKDACDFLKKRKIIDVEFRTVKTAGLTLYNVMFVDINMGVLKSITGINKSVDKPSNPSNGKGSVGGGTFERKTPIHGTEEGGTFERKTNTYSTTDNTTDTTTDETEKENVVDVSKIKSNIQNTLKANINYDKLINFLKEVELDTIDYYLDNWDRFKSTSKKNVVGFFIDCCKKRYDLPKEEKSTVKTNSNVPQKKNFIQREYTDEEFEEFVEKF